MTETELQAKPSIHALMHEARRTDLTPTQKLSSARNSLDYLQGAEALNPTMFITHLELAILSTQNAAGANDETLINAGVTELVRLLPPNSIFSRMTSHREMLGANLALAYATNQPQQEAAAESMIEVLTRPWDLGTKRPEDMAIGAALLLARPSEAARFDEAFALALPLLAAPGIEPRETADHVSLIVEKNKTLSLEQTEKLYATFTAAILKMEAQTPQDVDSYLADRKKYFSGPDQEHALKYMVWDAETLVKGQREKASRRYDAPVLPQSRPGSGIHAS